MVPFSGLSVLQLLKTAAFSLDLRQTGSGDCDGVNQKRWLYEYLLSSSFSSSTIVKLTTPPKGCSIMIVLAGGTRQKRVFRLDLGNKRGAEIARD